MRVRLRDAVRGLGAVIFGVLVHRDRLRVLIAHLDPDAVIGGSDAQIAIAQTTDQVEGLLRRLLTGEPKGVVLDALLDRLAHLRGRPEKTVGRNEPRNALMGAVKVVVVDPQPQSSLAVGEVREHGPRQELVP